ICDLARGLTERGHDVTLHCAEGSQVDGVKLVTVAAPPDAADALVMPGGSQLPPAPGVAAALGQIFQTIRAMDVDVISQHALAAARSAGIAVRLAGAHYDPAYVVDLHGVETLGSLARDELRRVMATSGVTVCAVRWEEPFGMVAAEAQMAGCPVAAYRRGA